MVCSSCQKETPSCELTAYKGRCENCAQQDAPMFPSHTLSGAGKWMKDDDGNRVIIEYQFRAVRDA